MVTPKKPGDTSIGVLYDATYQAIEDIREAQHRKHETEYKLKRRLMADGWDNCLTINMRAVKRSLDN